MASTKSVVDHILDLAQGRDSVRTRAMFGEYALYCDDKVVALICDDRLFLKPTDAGRALLPEAEEAPPYDGAKPYLVVPEDKWDEPGFLPRLVTETAALLPKPKPKRPRKAKNAD